MKKLILALAIFTGFFVQAVAQQVNTKQLVSALLQLKKDMLTDSIQKIIPYFKFPLNDKVLSAYFSSDTVGIKTQPHFKKHYKEIVGKDFFQTLKMLPFKQLETKKEIKYTVTPKGNNRPYIYLYKAAISGNEITISVLASNHPNNKKKNEEDEVGEYAYFWKIKFVNGKLVFEEIQLAG